MRRQLAFVVIAENLASHGVLTFSGSPYTIFPPLFMFMLAIPVKLGLSGFLSFKLLTYVSLLISCFVLYGISLRLTKDQVKSQLSVLLFASNSVILYHAIDFYSAIFFTLLTVLWFHQIMGKRYGTAGVLAGLACLTRPQGVLLIGFGVLYLLWLKDRRSLLTYVAVSLILPAAWGVRNVNVLSSYYEMPASTILSKPALVYLIGIAHPDLGPAPIIPKPHILFFFTSSYLIPVVGGFVVLGFMSRYGKTQLLGSFTLFYLLAHVTLIGGMDNLIRHLTPVIPFISVYAAEGLSTAVAKLKYRSMTLVIILLVLIAAQVNVARIDVRKTALIREQFLSGIRWVNENLDESVTVVDLLQPPHSIEYAEYLSDKRFTFAPELMQAYNPMSKYVLRQLSSTYPADDKAFGTRDVGEYADYVLISEPIPEKLKSWDVVYNYSIMSYSLTPPSNAVILKNPRIG